MEITIAKVYEPLFRFQKSYAALKSGRISGKSVVAGQLAIVCTQAYPKHDIVITRDSYSDLKNSIYSEIIAQVESLGLVNEYVYKLNPLQIYCKRTDCIIYFMGIGGSDIHRTKSFKPKHPLSLVVFEECQQLREQESLEQAHASFRRHLDTSIGSFLHLFNPEPQNFHWLNIYYKIKEHDQDWLCINSSYKDILDYITDLDLKEILKMKLTDKTRYDWMYMGATTGGFGSVYPQFHTSKHLINIEQAREKFGNLLFKALILGVDGAVTHDATVITPIGLLENGQALVLDLFYHDPKVSGQKASSELIPYISNWWSAIKSKYYFESNSSGKINVLCKIDSAAADLIRNLQLHFSNQWQVEKFTKPTILEMVGIVQSTLAKNMVYIVDYGGYQDYVLNKWIKAENPLAVQLESLVWNDKQTGYDPAIPNDASDSFTYATCAFYKNPEKVWWLDILSRQRKDFYDIEMGGN